MMLRSSVGWGEGLLKEPYGGFDNLPRFMLIDYESI